MKVLSWILTEDSKVQRNGFVLLRSPTSLSSTPETCRCSFLCPHLRTLSFLEHMVLVAKWSHTHYGHLLVLANIQDGISYTLSSKSGHGLTHRA